MKPGDEELLPLVLTELRGLGAERRSDAAHRARVEQRLEKIEAAVAGLAGLVLDRRAGTRRPAPADREVVLEQLLEHLDSSAFTAGDLVEDQYIAPLVAHICGAGKGAARRLGAWLGRCTGERGGVALDVVGRRAAGRVFRLRQT